MLKLKPNCEWCDKNLFADSDDAMICSYECTFCQKCVTENLNNVCPNCGGGFTNRPIRPKKAHRESVSLEHHPASKTRVHSPYSQKQLAEFVQLLERIPPKDR